MPRLPTLLLVIFPLAGCGSIVTSLPKTFPVTGKVLDAQGRPMQGGTVRFTQEKETTLTLIGNISKTDGSFSLKTYRNRREIDGVPPGEYQVTIQLPGEPRALPSSITLPTPVRVDARDNLFEFRLPD